MTSKEFSQLETAIHCALSFAHIAEEPALASVFSDLALKVFGAAGVAADSPLQAHRDDRRIVAS